MRTARDAAGFSLRELSEKVEISASTIGEYERGVRVPEADKLVRIASALNHFTFRIDDYTFTVGHSQPSDRPRRDEQLPLNFNGEYGYARARVKIEPGRISIAFDGEKARLFRPTASKN